MVRCCTVRCAPNFEGEEGRRNQRTRVRGQLLVWLVAGLRKISSQRVKKTRSHGTKKEARMQWQGLQSLRAYEKRSAVKTDNVGYGAFVRR